MTILADIVAATRHKVRESGSRADLRVLERQAAAHVPRGFRNALASASKTGIAIIAELKKASPSRGLIRADFDVAKLARQLEQGGAAALSVLTEEDFFQGSLANLQAASANVSIPCLRKDFIVDEFQLLEARASCADAVLLIVAALSGDELNLLARRARELQLDVLCEVHDEAERQRALDAGCDLIGVNSRDLKTFNISLDTAMRLIKQIPDNVLTVAESGIESGSDIGRLKAAGFDAFLIGETLMKTPVPGNALENLLAAAISVAR
jgi:indole-3-glycerol phosphate synthase